MTSMVRTISGNRRTGAVLLVALAAILAGLALFAGSGKQAPATLAEQTSASFGLGRDTVYVTPKATVSATFSVPSGIKTEDVAWKLVADGAITSGTGPTVEFTAPSTGTVELLAEVRVDTQLTRSRTTFQVIGAGRMVGTAVETRGTVLVDGGRAVQGEALPAGVVVDAKRGAISYTARATNSGDVSGRLEFSGASFVVNAEQVGAARRLNTVTVSKDPTGAPSTLHANVEHQDGVRYVKVESPDAVAMVKGTEFDVIVDGDGTDVAVVDGLLGVYDPARPFEAPEDVATGQTAGADRVDVVEEHLDAGTALGGTVTTAIADPATLYGDYSDMAAATDASQTHEAVFEPLSPEEFERMRRQHPDAVDELLGDWFLQAPQEFGDMFDDWAHEHPKNVDDVMKDWERDPATGGYHPPLPPPPPAGTMPAPCSTCTIQPPPTCATCSYTPPPTTCATCSPCATCSYTPPPTNTTTSPCATCTYTPPPTTCSTCNTYTPPPDSTTSPCSTCSTYTPPPDSTTSPCATCTYTPPPTTCSTCNTYTPPPDSTTSPCSTCNTYTPPPTGTTSPCSTCTYTPPPSGTTSPCSTCGTYTSPNGSTGSQTDPKLAVKPSGGTSTG